VTMAKVTLGFSAICVGERIKKMKMAKSRVGTLSSSAIYIHAFTQVGRWG
jgi:hypothetical protein